MNNSFACWWRIVLGSFLVSRLFLASLFFSSSPPPPLSFPLVSRLSIKHLLWSLFLDFYITGSYISKHLANIYGVCTAVQHALKLSNCALRRPCRRSPLTPTHSCRYPYNIPTTPILLSLSLLTCLFIFSIYFFYIYFTFILPYCCRPLSPALPLAFSSSLCYHFNIPSLSRLLLSLALSSLARALPGFFRF